MANTYSYIAKVSVGSGGTSAIEFTNIPSGYTDLKLVFSGKTDNNSWVSYIQLNNTTSDRSQIAMYGDNTGITVTTNATQIFTFNTYSSATNAGFAGSDIYIANYSSADVNKLLQITGGSVANQATQYIGFISGVYNNSSPISSIKLTESGATIQEFSTAYLYGIRNVV